MHMKKVSWEIFRCNFSDFLLNFIHGKFVWVHVTSTSNDKTLNILYTRKFVKCLLQFLTGISFWNVNILRSCAKPNTTCERCDKMNYALQIVLFYLGVGVFIARPVQLLYGFIHEEAVIDVIHSLSNTVVFSFLSLEYLTDFSHVKHRSSPN